MYTENVEKLFQQDIREKKRAASGAFHMRGKGVRNGFSGAIRTPYHFMSNKEKKQLNGEVRTYNMYETVITREEFELKDKETQRAMMLKWREMYPNGHIMNEMGITGNATFAKIVNQLDLPKKLRRGGRKPGTINKSVKAEVALIPVPTPEVVNKQTEPVTLIINGLALEYHGTYEAEAINKILTKVQILLEGEENKFEIHISVVERG